MPRNERGEVFIIDFDRASLKASKQDFERESERLTRFLEGEFINRMSIIGPGSSDDTILSDIEECDVKSNVSPVDGTHGTMSN